MSRFGNAFGLGLTLGVISSYPLASVAFWWIGRVALSGVCAGLWLAVVVLFSWDYLRHAR